MPATPLVVTLGDPAGIGPEIIAEAWRRRTEDDRPFAVFGAPEVLRAAGAPVVTLDRLEAAADVFREAIPVLGTPLAGSVRPGHPDSGCADAVTSWITEATEACLSGKAAALVTAPISKAVLKAAGFRHAGHTEFLGELTAGAPFAGERGPVMMLAAADLRVTLATIHLPISRVAAALTFEGLLRTIRVTAQALARDFGCAQPRLAVAGLNPHAGESGEIGREEIDLIRPAVEALRAEGMDVTGPLPADSLFATGMRERFDAIVCMYHDQALIPVKMLDFWGGVNITLGLPIVRTSPDHGTAFDIAGKGLARPDSFIAALKAAAAIADRRAA
jgi:4-hydroxythreonine-4-phosphate dehydrogenase